MARERKFIYVSDWNWNMIKTEVKDRREERIEKLEDRVEELERLVKELIEYKEDKTIEKIDSEWYRWLYIHNYYSNDW